MDFVLILSVLFGLVYLSAEWLKGQHAREFVAVLFARRGRATVSATSWGYILSPHTSSHTASHTNR